MKGEGSVWSYSLGYLGSLAVPHLDAATRFPGVPTGSLAQGGRVRGHSVQFLNRPYSFGIEPPLQNDIV